MTKIDQHIEELLQHYDCVIIPSFGGFIASQKPGFLDEKAGVFHPPFKKILFNKHLTENDGLLTNHISTKQQISFDEANSLLTQYKDGCFAKLNTEGKVEIEKVGVLFFDAEKNIQFHQSSRNFLLASFGLSSKFLTPLPKEVLKKEKEVKLTIENSTQKELSNRASIKQKPVKAKKTSKKGVWITLMVLPLIVGGLYVGNQMGFVGSNKIQLSNLNPFASESSRYNQRTQIYESIVKEIENSSIEQPKITDDTLLQHPNIASDEVVQPAIEETTLTTTPTHVFHIIGGCFSQKENAESMVKKWEDKGFKAQIIDHNGGLYKVSISHYNTLEGANSIMNQLIQEFKISAWVLKK